MFAGSGSTGRACEEVGCKHILFDNDYKYFNQHVETYNKAIQKELIE